MDDLTKEFKSELDNLTLHQKIVAKIHQQLERDDYYHCLNCFKDVGCDMLEGGAMCTGCCSCYCDKCIEKFNMTSSEDSFQVNKCFVCDK